MQDRLNQNDVTNRVNVENPASVRAAVLSLFTARYRWLDRKAGTIEPTLIGTAFVNAEATLLLDEKDPFCWGIHP